MNNKIYNDLAIELTGAALVGVIVWLAGYISFLLPAWICIITLIFGIFLGWLISIKQKKNNEISNLEGDALSRTKFYPIVMQENIPIIDMKIFVEAIDQYKNTKNQRAAFELCYLGKYNAIETRLSSDKIKDWRKLCERNFKEMPDEAVALRNSLFNNFKQIIEGIGKTINSKHIEFVLHDIRNPLHSIVAIVNPISNRKVDDPTTDFGINLIKGYNDGGFEGNEINYKIKMKDRNIKASTIVLENEEFGQFGFICINIDIDNLDQTELLKSIKFIDTKNKVNEKIK